MSFRYIIFNKPYGVVSQFSGEGETLRQYVPVKNVYPVGRLDHDSEGLLLLTDDGVLQHQLTDPSYEHPRTYLVQVEGVPGEEALGELAKGVTIREYRTRPAQVRVFPDEPQLPPRNPPVRFRKTVPTTWLEITLTEGRNRQVRRMTAAVAHPTLRLVRVAIGELRLEGLSPGEWRDLSRHELAALSTGARNRKPMK